jgi:PAS domain S-box-containing protein
LEELEDIVSAISGGQVDAVVVEHRGQAEVWTLESTDRLHLKLCEQAANLGTWHWDAATGELTCSQTLLELVGLPVTTRTTVERAAALIHPDDRVQCTHAVQAAVAQQENYYDEFRIVRPDGQIRWLSSRGRVIRSADDRVERVVGICLDITERRQNEETLKVADRRKDEFLAMLAHELRNPLAAITNAVRLSRSGQLDEQDLAWIQEMLDRQLDLVGRLVDDLLDVARITQGRLDLKLEIAPLSEIVNRAVEAVRPMIDRARHQLTVKFSPERMWVNADRSRLQQVLVNLLTNAAKVQVSSDGGDAVIAVRDSGIGIGREMLPKVFDMFAQAEQGLARSQGGLGIGLTLVRRLVEGHGGYAEAHSSGPGQGSTFTIRLPLVQRAEAAPTAPQVRTKDADRGPIRTDGQPLRVLVVDDNRDGAQTLARLLRISGHETEVAFDGRAALEAAKRTKPQLALLDIGLPGMDGYELAQRLRKDHADIYLAAVSGYGQAADRQRAKEAGFDQHFVKPVKLEALLQLLGDTPG